MHSYMNLINSAASDPIHIRKDFLYPFAFVNVLEKETQIPTTVSLIRHSEGL